jgi:hypothetical protein
VLFEMRRTSAAVAAVMASGAPSRVAEDDAPGETAPPVAPFEPRMPEPVAAAETEPEARLSNWQ